MKLFNTSDIALVKQCQEKFSFILPSVALERRRTKFLHKICCVDFTWSGRNMGYVRYTSFDIALSLYFSIYYFSLYFTTICGK